MKRPMKRILVLLLCAALAAGAAVAAGLSSGDSLVSLSHLEQTVVPKAVEQGFAAVKEQLDEVARTVSGALDELADGYLNKAGRSGQSGSSPSYGRRVFSLYDVITLESGAGVIVEAGSVVLSHAGTVVDVTTGAEAPSGLTLIPGHRYLVAEETQADLTVESDAARAALEGGYTVSVSGEPATPFTDINVRQSFHDAVGAVYRRGLFAGTGDGSIFAPGDKLNRAMMVTVLFHLAGDPDEERFAATRTFTDIKGGEWYESYVRWAGQQGVSAGYGDGSFQPEALLTRREVVQFLYNFGRSYLKLELAERSDISAMDGAEILRATGWGEEAMSWAVGAGVIGELRPDDRPDRGEVAQIMATFAEKYPK